MQRRWPSWGLGLAGLLLLSLPVSAAMGNWKCYRFLNLTGGLSDTADSSSIALNEAAAIQNYVFSTSGSIIRRLGFTRLNSSTLGASAVVSGLTYYKQADGDRFLVSLVSDGTTDTVQKMDYTSVAGSPDGTWDSITGSTALSFTHDEPVDFATATDNLYIAYGDGTRSLLKWTGTGDISELTTLPDATMVEFHKRILWVAGNSTDKSCVQFSGLDTPETFNDTDCAGTGDYLLIETDDGQVITGLKSALDCLYIFKSESIWRACGADRDNLYVEQMVRGTGAASNQSIALINNKFLFLTSQGNVAIYDGGINIQILSGKIHGTLSQLNPARFAKALATAFDDGSGDEDYYLCLSTESSSTNDLMLYFDTYHQAWSKFTGLPCSAMAVYAFNTGQQALALGSTTGYVNRYPDGNTDAGTAIVAYYQSGDATFGDIPQEKTFHDIQLIAADAGTDRVIGFQYQVDYGATKTSSGTASLAGAGAVWDTAVWDTDVYADASTVIRRRDINASGDFLNWRVEQRDGLSPVLIKGVQVWAEEAGRVGELGDAE